MTAAICDRLTYTSNTFSIIKVDGEGLFNPIDYEIETTITSTADYRGFHCNYKVVDNCLILTEVYLGLDKYLSLDKTDKDLIASENSIKLFGQIPHRYKEKDVKGKEFTSWDFCCDNLLQPVKFTGGMLIGSGNVPGMFTARGFPSPYTLNKVHELVFDNGQLIEAMDCSKKMSDFRNSMKTFKIWQDAEKFLKNCFSWDYELD